jgi:hypothetical protein
MKKYARWFAFALCLFIWPRSGLAQTPAPVKTPTKARDASVRSAGDPLTIERRAQATALLSSLADEARGFHDEALRARVQAQAADALWESDQERGRALFRRAWDAAEAADQENMQRTNTELRTQRMAAGRPNLRAEVLRLAAKRDRALGEGLLARLDATKKQENNQLTSAAASAPSSATAANDAPTAQPRRDPYATPPELERRLRLAMDFLSDGDVERALQFADPALVKPYESAVEFLVNLREKSPDAADQRYVALLMRAAADPDSDANTVLLLSSYVLTPHMYMVVEPGGSLSRSQRRRDITPPTDMPAPIKQAFSETAARILLRPLPPLDQDSSTSGRDGAYFVIARLLPYIEQNAPQAGADLRARLAALTPDVPAQQRSEMDRDLNAGLVSEAERGDQVQDALDRAPQAQTPAQRDQLYMQAAMAASFKNDSRAHDLADKIANADLRQQVRAFIDFAAVNQAIQKKDGAETLRLAQTGELAPVQRVWALTEAARLLLENDRPRSIEALEAAVVAAGKIDGDSPDRARALVAVATQFVKVDRNRAWEVLAEAVKAGNATPEFTGADAGLNARVQTQNMRSMINFSAPSLDLRTVFAALALEDLSRAVELAKSFTGEAPRATATIAVARAVLDAKPAAKKQFGS